MNPMQPNALRIAMLGVLAATMAASFSAPLGVRVVVLVLPAIVAVAEADLMWRVVRARPRYRWARVRQVSAELAVLLVASAATASGATGGLAAFGAWPVGFWNRDMAVGFMIAAGVWFAVTATLDDMARLGELSESMADELLPMPRLRWRYLWFGTASAIAAAVGLVGWSSIIDLSRPMGGGVVWWVVAYFVLGAVGLARANVHDSEVRWRHQHVVVAPAVHARSRGWAMLASTAILAIVLFTPAGDGAPITRLARAGLQQIGRLGERVVAWLERFQRSTGDATDLTLPTPDQPLTLPDPDVVEIDPGEPLFGPDVVATAQDFLFLAVVLTVIGLVLWVTWRQRRDIARAFREIRVERGVVRAWLGFAARFMQALRERLRGLFRRPGRDSGVPSRRTPERSQRPVRRDPAGLDVYGRRVRAAYRAFVDRTARFAGPRRSADTPDEYLGRLAAEREDLRSASVVITATYERLRYAPARPSEREAVAAEQALTELERVVGEE